ncbi:MAG: HNH endonuclease [Bacteroidales bacterium]|nr:HNH endonuclease [Bacteroidales bacterium]
MEAKEDFLIPNFYSLTDEDKAAIQNAKSQPPKADDWENGGLSGFKRRFKKSLKRLQNSHCAYCRTKVWDANNFFAIEHIVHKSDHPEWMFLPENLCLSCSRCNSHKGTKNVLVKVGATTYPNASTDFLIVNPYYDKYSDHIELVDGILYKGLTPKGRKTIQICKL